MFLRILTECEVCIMLETVEKITSLGAMLQLCPMHEGGMKTKVMETKVYL